MASASQTGWAPYQGCNHEQAILAAYWVNKNFNRKLRYVLCRLKTKRLEHTWTYIEQNVVYITNSRLYCFCD